MRYLKVLMMILVGVALYGCTTETEETFVPVVPTEETLREFTLTELLEYDGTNGKDAYIAVSGFVYDVTDSTAWRNGGHNGFQAGRDLTAAITTQSPHGTSFLDRVPLIGIIVEE